ncbi:hypothetical protein ACOMHN_053499 [Nucella lapillus]
MAERFDKSPIMDEGYTFRSWRFSVREGILGVVLVVLLVACLFLAGFLGKSSSDLQQAQTGAQKAQNACKGSTCLRTTAHIMELLNTSVSPCDNFYNFACGNYRVKNPVDEYTLYQSIAKQMYQENQDLLMSILNSPSTKYTDWSSERKVKDYFASCMDDFRLEQLKAKPLFDKVFPLLGGWYVKDGASWNADSWDLNSALKVVHSELWLDAMYSLRVRRDDYRSNKGFILIYPGGKGNYMRWNDYTDTPTDLQSKLQADYKQFLRTVAGLVARDAGLSTASDQGLTNRINVFVADAYEVEADLAKFASNAEYQRSPYIEANRPSLNDLNQRTGGPIDWTVQMSYLFNEAGVTGDTKVVVPYPTYLTNLTAMIRGLDSASRNRKLNNYLTWRVLETYIQSLSWDYVHANRQFYVDKYGRPNFLGKLRYCFYMTQHEFDIALGALYIRARFDMNNKKKVVEITESVKTAMETMITSNNWMDQATKDYAIAKLTINRTDYLGNTLSCNLQHKRELNRRLRQVEDRDQWYFNAYDNVLAVVWFWDEIIVPAGVLRFPMYEYDMPHYYSFGALGTLLGHVVHHLIDEIGRRYGKGGDLTKTSQGWWSNQTVTNYNKAKQCVADLYSNVTQGPYISQNGDQTVVNVNGKQYAWEAMALTTGIRMSYNAYQTWQQKYGQDFTSPGLPYSPQQLFFIAHAQIQCYNRDPYYDYLYAQWGRVHQDVRVNLAFKELPEFKQAFQCQATDQMVSPKPCTYY